MEPNETGEIERIARHLRAAVQDAPSGALPHRLFHGRGRAHPGLGFLNIDFYPPVAVTMLYEERPDEWVAALDEELAGVLGGRCGCHIVQRRYLLDAPSSVVRGEVDENPVAVEAGLSYRLRLLNSRNLGFFPDMAGGRALVARLAQRRRVLNLFAYTCSFSVAALAVGAAHVVNVDMNRGALSLGRDNHADNGLDPRRASFLAHNVFKSFGKIKRLGPYGVVVIDPPSDQGASFKAERDWEKIIRRLPEWLEPGADVVACLNAPHLGPEFMRGLFAEHVPNAVLVEMAGAGDDFPESEPERGLKIFHYRLG